ncbi:alpha/beta hydrolase [Aquabacterium sp.]|uniref:alpha/beta hydrolase n=1 Tax=Aquabacterium sp. TaxID=1872578 RepID=UPI0035B0E803
MAAIGWVFVHGWGLDAGFWQPLRAALSAQPGACGAGVQHALDAGYFGAAGPRIDWAAASRWIAVGHSLGWARAWLEGATEAPPGGWAASVSVCGFTRFCATAPGQSGQATRVVDRMVRAFDHDASAVLRDFLARCGLPDLASAASTTPDTAGLRADLARLRDLDLPPAAWSAVPLLALAARDDAIVSPALTHECFGAAPRARLAWHDSAGHALGRIHAHWCAEHLQRFVQELPHG